MWWYLEIRLRWGYEGEAPWCKYCSYKKRERPEYSLHLMSTWGVDSWLKTRERISPGTKSCIWHLDLVFQPPGLWEIRVHCLSRQSTVLRYGSSSEDPWENSTPLSISGTCTLQSLHAGHFCIILDPQSSLLFSSSICYSFCLGYSSSAFHMASSFLALFSSQTF